MRPSATDRLIPASMPLWLLRRWALTASARTCPRTCRRRSCSRWEGEVLHFACLACVPRLCRAVLTPCRAGRQVVEAYNADPKVHGILVQLPLPKHISEKRILDAISIEKVRRHTS